MTRLGWTLFFLTCALLTGCLPEKRIVWSPNGARAIVAADKGLFLVDATGRVLAPKLLGESIRAAWFDDNKRLAVVRSIDVEGWNGLSELVSPAQLTEIKSQSDDLRRRILAYDGDWEKFEIDPEKKLTPGMEAAMLVYVRDNAAPGLKEKLGSKWTDLAQLRPGISQLQVFELGDKDLRPGKVLVRTLEQILVPEVAPGGRAIAYLRRSEKNPEALGALFVVSAEGGSERHVAENVAMKYDWSPDGNSLAFISAPVLPADSDASIQLGALSTVVVAGTDGTLEANLSKQEDRVGLLFNEALCVEWLKDGGLMFSSVEVSLPVTARDMPQRWSIFLLDPRTPATVQRVLARDFTKAMDMSDPRFELSPDERRAVITGPSGELNIYNFATGETVSVEAPADSKLVSFPDWRNTTQFVFARSPAKAGNGEGQVSTWSDGSIQTLSDKWPTDLTEWIKKQD